MNRKQRVSMIVRMLLVPFTRPPFSGEDLLLERTRTYNEFLESTDIYYQPKLQAYKDRRDRFIRSLEGEMKPDRLSELEELLQMFYPEEEMAAYLRGNGSRRLEGYYFGVLLKIATEFVTLRDGRVSIKMWDTPEHSEEEVFPHSSGLYKVELWSEISRVITPDVLIAGYFVQCGIRDPRYLRGIPDNITLSDALLNRVNGKGIAETHLHLSAGMNYLSVWEAVTDPAALRITPVRETSTYQRHQRREQKGHRNLLVAGWLRLMMAKYFLDAEGKSGGPPEERGIFDLPAYYYRLEKDSGEKELEVRLLEAVLSDALTPEALSALQDLLREKSEQHLEILYTDYGVRPGQTALDVLMRGPYLPYAPLGASGEMLLLFFSLQHIRDFPEHIGFQRVFLCYLRIKNAYFSDKLQPTGLSGLTFFRRYFTSGVTAALVRRGDDSQKIRLAYRAAFLNQFHCGTLRKLEVKISPPRISGSPGANTVRRAAAKQLAELFTVYYTLLEESQAVSREERPTLGVVYHFLRKDVLRAPLRFCWASQPEQDPQDPVSRLRLEGAQFVTVLQELLRTVPLLSEYVVGLDVASEEIGSEPWVYAPVYRQARNRKNTVPVQLESGRTLQNLGLTYHVGEDYHHILSGLRHIDEVLTYFGYKAGDRLGHGLALQIDVGEWIHNNEVVSLPVMEHLENLLWLWSLCGASRGELSGNLPYLEKEIMELAQRIYCNTKGLTPHVLWSAYTRKFKPLEGSFCKEMMQLYFCAKEKVAVPPAQRTFCVRANENASSPCAERIWDADRLLLTHYCPIYAHRYQAPYFSAAGPEQLPLFQAAQSYVKEKVQTAGVYVETNPTSNLVIGDIRGWANYSITHLNNRELSQTPPASILISVNSDDPLLLNTNTENELALVYHTLIYRGISREDVLAWIDKIRQYGMDSSFIRTVKPVETQISELKKIAAQLERIGRYDMDGEERR